MFENHLHVYYKPTLYMTLQKKTLNKPQTPYKRFEVLKEFF